MSSDRVGAGILGFAHGHVGMYCSQWNARPELGVKVVAGWDHDPARAEGNCGNFGCEWMETVEALLGRDDIQAVVIGAETSMHADLVEQAAEAGKTIILQKPIGLEMDEADRIVKAVNGSRTADADGMHSFPSAGCGKERHSRSIQSPGVPFTMAWQMRVERFNLQAKLLLESADALTTPVVGAGPDDGSRQGIGAFGRVFQVRRRHCLATQHMKDFETLWHVKPEFNRDIFADDAAHPIDFIYWLLGMPSTVYAEFGTLLNPKVPNDNAIVLFRYPDGKMAEVSCSFVAVAGENTLEIVCEHGVIIGNYGDGPSNHVRPAGAPQLKWIMEGQREWTVSDLPEINGQGERIAGLSEPLAEFLHGNRPPIATAEEGRDVLRLVLACYESVEQGRKIVL